MTLSLGRRRVMWAIKRVLTTTNNNNTNYDDGGGLIVLRSVGRPDASRRAGRQQSTHVLVGSAASPTASSFSPSLQLCGRRKNFHRRRQLLYHGGREGGRRLTLLLGTPVVGFLKGPVAY